MYDDILIIKQAFCQLVPILSQLRRVYRNIKMSIQRPRCSLHEIPFTFSLLIKIGTTASKFYSFLRTSISIYRKKWKSDAGLAKLLPPLPTGGGKKCCRRVRRVLIAMSGKSFPCCGLRGAAGGDHACALIAPQRQRASPVQDFVSDAGMLLFFPRYAHLRNAMTYI